MYKPRGLTSTPRTAAAVRHIAAHRASVHDGSGEFEGDWRRASLEAETARSCFLSFAETQSETVSNVGRIKVTHPAATGICEDLFVFRTSKHEK